MDASGPPLELLQIEKDILHKIVNWSSLLSHFNLPAATNFNKFFALLREKGKWSENNVRDVVRALESLEVDPDLIKRLKLYEERYCDPLYNVGDIGHVISKLSSFDLLKLFGQFEGYCALNEFPHLFYIAASFSKIKENLSALKDQEHLVWYDMCAYYLVIWAQNQNPKQFFELPFCCPHARGRVYGPKSPAFSHINGKSLSSDVCVVGYNSGKPGKGEDIRKFCDDFEKHSLKNKTHCPIILIRSPRMDRIVLNHNDDGWLDWAIKIVKRIFLTWEELKYISSFGGEHDMVFETDDEENIETINVQSPKSVLHHNSEKRLELGQGANMQVISILTWCQKCNKRVEVYHDPSGVGSRTRCFNCGRWI